MLHTEEHRDETVVHSSVDDKCYDIITEDSLDQDWEVMSQGLRDMFKNKNGSRKRVSLHHVCKDSMTVT